jgi:hypothetical protein
MRESRNGFAKVHGRMEKITRIVTDMLLVCRFSEPFSEMVKRFVEADEHLRSE